jgi:hypothetical protein
MKMLLSPFDVDCLQVGHAISDPSYSVLQIFPDGWLHLGCRVSTEARGMHSVVSELSETYFAESITAWIRCKQSLLSHAKSIVIPDDGALTIKLSNLALENGL